MLTISVVPCFVVPGVQDGVQHTSNFRSDCGSSKLVNTWPDTFFCERHQRAADTYQLQVLARVDQSPSSGYKAWKYQAHANSLCVTLTFASIFMHKHAYPAAAAAESTSAEGRRGFCSVSERLQSVSEGVSRDSESV